ncbi:MAG: purine-nucleoside phosphorylase [Candidatus Nanoarchaeia archaeon]
MNIREAEDFERLYEERVRYASKSIKKKIGSLHPSFAITLGSGLGDLADLITEKVEIEYSEIAHFPIPTVPGHAGKLVAGKLEGVPVLGLSGRTHYYEVADHPMNTGILKVVFPVHVLAELGIENYFVTNAAGGLNPDYQVGSMMLLRSHLNFHIPNPLMGRHMAFTKVNSDRRTDRFQPMNGAYDLTWREMLHEAAARSNAGVHSGVYAAVTGPTYESEAESMMLKRIGADAVGMSTAPEVVVARNRGMRVVGFSCITNKIASDGTNATSHDEVKAVLESEGVRARYSSTVKEFFRLYHAA